MLKSKITDNIKNQANKSPHKIQNPPTEEQMGMKVDEMTEKDYTD